MKPALVISERDNVATALEALEPGRAIDARRRSTLTVARARFRTGTRSR